MGWRWIADNDACHLSAPGSRRASEIYRSIVQRNCMVPLSGEGGPRSATAPAGYSALMLASFTIFA